MYRIGREEQSVSIRSWQKNVEQAIKVTYELSDYYGKIDEDISDQNMKRYILEKVSSSAINKYRILLSFPAKREVKERIKNYDKELSSVNPEIRRECSSNKLVLLLMIPGMPLYRLLSIIYRKHLRKKGLL
jgi:adenylate kinase family enzyme